MRPEDNDPPTGPEAEATANAEAAGNVPADTSRPGQARLGDDLRNMAAQGGDAIDALRRTVDAASDLFLAEASLARQAALRIALLALSACVLLLGGWLFLMTALAAWLQSTGVSWVVAAATVAAVSMLLGALALWRVARLAPLLGFPRSRRQLRQQGQAT